MHFVSRHSRLFFHFNGIKNRSANLFYEYVGGKIEINKGDIVIDCGANIGEFSIYCSNFGAEVHSFEPDPTEYRALLANKRPGMKVNNLALWNESSIVTFYDKNDTGDSSIINPGKASRKLTVDALRLEDYLIQEKLFRIKLLKLEAEGAELEVLQGAGDLLRNFDYISVDMGPERGVSSDNTVPDVVNLLLGRDFKMIYFFHVRCAALFRNTKDR